MQKEIEAYVNTDPTKSSRQIHEQIIQDELAENDRERKELQSERKELTHTELKETEIVNKEREDDGIAIALFVVIAIVAFFIMWRKGK